MVFNELSKKETSSTNGGSITTAIGVFAAGLAIASEVYSAYEGYKDAEAGVYNRDGRPGQ